MSEENITPDEAPVEDVPTETPEAPETDPAGADQLGDAGKKALDSMKERMKAERDKRRELEARLAELTAPKAATETPDLDAVRAEAAREATAKANARILKSELRAAATGKLADPADVHAFIDASKFEVDENGDVDAEEIADAIESLLTSKPHLAAATVRRFQGTGDGGAARKASGPSQLSRSDLAGMSAAQIDQARKDGRLNNLLSGQ
ncbi:hypothetical protein ACFPA8_07995 [Streptomyces ovatisporus]|uniref:Scaffolding protein n=1 Tax=Streptomyces ovatisporus TaxID=1128682 RepID=A0ABV9A6A3_9ACTN